MNVPFVTLTLNLGARRQFQLDEELADRSYENVAVTPSTGTFPDSSREAPHAKH